MEISNKHKVIYALARGLRYRSGDERNVMSGSELASLLNDLGYRANSGKPFKVGGRGIYNCIHAAYDSFYKCDGDGRRAGWIATAFCDKYGKYAWDHDGKFGGKK